MSRLKLPFPKMSGGVPTWEDFNKLYDYVEKRMNIEGFGVLVEQKHEGTTIKALVLPSDDTGALLPRDTLDNVMGTADADSWTMDGETGIEEKVLTDIKWDSDSATLQVNVRNNCVSPGGRIVEISAEGAVLNVLSAVNETVVTGMSIGSNGAVTLTEKTISVLKSVSHADGSGGVAGGVTANINAYRLPLLARPGTKDTDTWALGALHSGSPEGVEIIFLSDIYWNTVDGKLYAATRTAKYDPSGLLIAVTAETDLLAVDMGADCTS